MMKTPISWFDISWTSRMDGPGTRVVLYVSGCHLRCPWCHSPHSWEHTPALMFFHDRCLLCGACQDSCPNGVHMIEDGRHTLDRERCERCGKCVSVCPTTSTKDSMSGALTLPGSRTDPEELFDKLSAQLELLKRIGGLTIGGGEPLLQERPLKRLLQKCVESGYNTAVETSGSVPQQSIRNLLDLVDCWLFGLRPIPAERYKKTHTVDMRLVEVNLQFLTGAGRGRVIIRTPIIPDYTNNSFTFSTIADLMAECGLSEIELLPLNPYSGLYYHAMGMIFPLGNNSRLAEDDLKAACNFFKGREIETRVVRSGITNGGSVHAYA
ncbi:MAG: glycyl-radical enzyme activating protein [Fidelibacterota bacterium]|nr:MAG: glycyl-radical enzyme activating protein [Candidatus Neomarinimicrobiota bacterium]